MRDTPFLHDNTNKHVKTYVAPAPDADQLPDPTETLVNEEEEGRRAKIEVRQGKRYFVYSRFPNLRPDYYATARNTTSQHMLVTAPALAKTSAISSLQSRLKRLPMFRGTSTGSANATTPTNPSACVFSAFLVVFTRVVTRGFSVPSVRRAPPTVTQLLDQFQSATPRISESFTSAPALLNKSEIDEEFSGGQRSVSMMAASTSDIPSDLERVASALKARRNSVQGISSRSRSVSSSNGASFAPSGNSPFRSRSSFKNYSENVKEEFLTAARAAIEVRL